MHGNIHISNHTSTNDYLRCTRYEVHYRHDRVHKQVVRCTKKCVPRFLILESLKNFLFIFLEKLVSKLPLSPNIFTYSSVTNVKFKLFKLQTFWDVSWKNINVLKDLNPSKALGTKSLGGKFLKDGADILARLISEPCNLFIKVSFFARSFKIPKAKPLFK